VGLVRVGKNVLAKWGRLESVEKSSQGRQVIISLKKLCAVRIEHIKM
jgi:hypothetical protein